MPEYSDRYSTMDQGSEISYPSNFDIDPSDPGTFNDYVDRFGQAAQSSTRMLTGIDRFIQDPETTFTDRTIKLHEALDVLLGGPSSAPVQWADSADCIASPLSVLSLEIPDELSRKSTNDGSTFSSFGATSVSRSAHHPTTSLDLGTVPSIHTMPDIEFDELPIAAERVRVSVNCIFKDIDRSPCDETPIGEGFDAWYRHHLSHFEPHGPPGYALCGFCDAEFEKPSKPKVALRRYLEHLWASHLRNGANLVDMRPDFRTLTYMLDKDIITKYRYDEICEVATERKQKDYPFLRPADWVPDKHKAKKCLEEEEEYNATQRVIVKEKPVRRRDKDRRGSRQ